MRIHSECFTGDILTSRRCDCNKQLYASMSRIEEEGSGVLLYMRQEGRGIGLFNKLRAYQLQDSGLDTVEANHRLGFEADLRSYDICAEILKHLKVSSIRLLTNNPEKISSLESYGIIVRERIPLVTEPNRFNRKYLETKTRKMGHLL